MICRKINIEFNEIKEEIVEVYIAVGMITENQYDFFIRNTKNALTISIITGVHMPTPPSVLKKLMEAEKSSKLLAKIYKENYFHPKLYLFKLKDESWLAFIGSGNFTHGGWFENEELFVKTTDNVLCKNLKAKFHLWSSQSIKLTNDFINHYTDIYIANESYQKETRKNIKQLLDQLENNFNINNVDFSNQFFLREHHEAFHPDKTPFETLEILAERRKVNARLLQLNDLLIQNFSNDLKVYPHYNNEHITPHIENSFHHDYNVRGLWLAYGRNKSTLKNYGEWATPLQFMRMQVIVKYDYIGCWLMPGKSGDGQLDREYFLKQMQSEQNRNQFYSLLYGLGEGYWIEIAGKMAPVNSFASSEDLHKFIQLDDWRTYYFTIGRNYNLGSVYFTKKNIVQTIISDFAKFYPIYEMIRDKTF